MVYSIKNEYLSAEFSSLGAELLSVKNGEGLEFIWQGDEKFWGERSPLLFPYCCRLFGGHYTYEGERFYGEIHGFIRKTEFSDVECLGDKITFKARANDETKKLYPFDFEFEMTYALKEKSLVCSMTLKNPSPDEIYYTAGMHPGFNVPLEGEFEDWRFEFAEAASPRRIIFSEAKFCKDYVDFSPELKDGKILPLTHSLFDKEAIFLLDVPHSISIRSDKSEHFVTVDYPDASVLGFWQPEFTDAPFVCIEPLCGMASIDGQVDDIKTKAFTRAVASGESHTDTVTITFN